MPEGAARRRRRRSSPSSARRWDLHVTRGPRHDARREPADDRRLGRLLQAARAARCSTTPSTSSTATRRNPDYALQTLQAAADAGRVGRDPLRHQRRHAARGGRRGASTGAPTRARVRARHPLPQRLRPGRRQHAGGRRAAGATQVQGTINGIGERCGNVDLVSVIANLALKYGYDVLQPGSLRAPDGGLALRLRDWPT